MSSENRVSANRVNCRHSTGPRTDRGKKSSSLNAIKHGLRAKTDVIPGDRPYSYKSFRRQLLLELSPQSLLEHELADRIIGDLWRLKRIPKLESAIFREMRTKEPSVPPALAELAIALAQRDRNCTDTYDSSSSSESSRDKGRRASSPSLSRCNSSRDSKLSRSAPADRLHSPHPRSTGWLDYSEHFSRFIRYESSLERSLFRCLKEYRDARSSMGGMDKGRRAFSPSIVHASTLCSEASAKEHARKRVSPKPSVPGSNIRPCEPEPASPVESTSSPTQESRPPYTPSHSSNSNPRNHFRRPLYHDGLASFGNSCNSSRDCSQSRRAQRVGSSVPASQNHTPVPHIPTEPDHV